MELAEKIYAAVRLIPRGKVATYSQIAALVGNCKLRRYVGLLQIQNIAIKPINIYLKQKKFLEKLEILKNLLPALIITMMDYVNTFVECRTSLQISP